MNFEPNAIELEKLREAMKEGQALLEAHAAKKRLEKRCDQMAQVVIAQAQGKLHLWGWPVLAGGK